MPLGSEQPGFDLRVLAETAKASGGRDHAMIGKAGLIGAPHDLAHGSSRAGASSQPRHVAVGGDPSDGNASHDVQDPAREYGRGSALGHGETLF